MNNRSTDSTLMQKAASYSYDANDAQSSMALRARVKAQAARIRLLETENLKLKNSLQDLDPELRSLQENEKLKALNRVIAGVAHEINTPLGLSITALSLVKTQILELVLFEKQSTQSLLLANESYRTFDERVSTIVEAIELMNRNLEKTSGHIRGLKNVASDQFLDQLRRVDLAAVIMDIVECFKYEIHMAEITLTLNLPSGIVITTRPDSLWQVVSNLVMNALVHAFGTAETKEKKKEISISLVQLAPKKHNPKGLTVQISFSDNGCGIPVDIQSRIFDPFFTTKRQSGGTGLGLSIVLNLISNALNGTIVYQTNSSGGSSFIVTLADLSNL